MLARARAPHATADAAASARTNPTLPRLWAPTITFSSSVIDGNSARFWNVRAMPRLGDAVRRPVQEVAARRRSTVPASARRCG